MRTRSSPTIARRRRRCRSRSSPARSTGVGQVEVAPPAHDRGVGDRRRGPPRAGRRSSCSATTAGWQAAPIRAASSTRCGSASTCGRPRSTAAISYIENAWWTDRRPPAGAGQAGHLRPRRSRAVPSTRSRSRRSPSKAGELAQAQIHLTRAYTSDGWVAGDFHIHSQPSTDSGLPIDQRVASCAAEGLEVAVATDHNYITDYAPVIAATGLDPWLLGIPGLELTTFEMGHFIGYPLKVDPGSTPRRRVRVAEAAAGEAVRAAAPARRRSGLEHRPGRAPATGGARVLRAVLRRSGDRRAVHADRHHGRVRAVRRRVCGEQLQLRLRRDRAASPAAASRTSTRTARRTRCRRDRSPIRSRWRGRSSSARTAGRCSRASSRPGSRCSIAATRPPAWARATATTCSATSRVTRARCVFVGARQGRAGRVLARRTCRRASRPPRDRDERAVHRHARRHRDDRRHRRAERAGRREDPRVDSPSWAKANHLVVYSSGGQIVADMPITPARTSTRS